MERKIQFKVHSIHLKTDSENQLSYPLFDKSFLAINQSKGDLHRKYAEYLANSLAKNQDFAYLSRKEINSLIEHDTIHLEVAQADFCYDKDLRLGYEFTWIYWKAAKDQYIGLVPILGLELIAVSLEELQKNLTEFIRNDLIHRNYLQSATNMLSTQWFLQIQAQSQIRTLSYGGKEQQEKPLYKKILDKIARQSDTTKGLAKQYKTLLENLSGDFPSSMLIVGPSGSGKSALIYQALNEIQEKQTMQIRECTAAKLIRGLMDMSGWQSNLAKLSRELSETDVIVYLGRWREYFEIGQYEGNDVSVGEALYNDLRKHPMLFVAECSEEEYNIFEHRFPAFAALFSVIKMPNFSQQQLEEILYTSIGEYAKEKNRKISKDSILEILRLQKRFAPYSGFPGKALQILKNILSRTNSEALTQKTILQYYSQESGIPLAIIDPSLQIDEEELQSFFQTRVIGQQQAIQSVSNAILTVKANLSPANKPIASLFFVGPTGVGKTELTKSLAEYIFTDRRKMIRLDMSEYASSEAILRITGDIPSDHSLLNQVKSNPFAVVLFDEVEKAHPNFFDLLLQILDEGRLTNAKGDTINFCSSIIILTSNLGGRESFRANLGFDKQSQQVDAKYTNVISSFFRPELVNRFDEIIVFQALGEAERLPILQKELRHILQRPGFASRKIQLELAEEVESYLLAKSYNIQYGARDMKRSLQREFTQPLAEVLNQHPAKQAQKIHVQLLDNALTFTTQNLAEKEYTVEEELQKITLYRRSYYAVWDSKDTAELEDIQEQVKDLLKLKRSLRAWEKQTIQRNEEIRIALKAFYQLEDAVVEAEGASFLELLDKTEAPFKTQWQAKEWLTSFHSSCRDLYRLSRRDLECWFTIYGNDGLLRRYFAFYREILQNKQYTYTCYAIIWNEGEYKESKAPGKKELDKLKKIVGLHFEIHGDCPFSFLQAERGLHTFIEKEESKHIYAQTSPEKPKVPEKVHRKEFYENLQKEKKNTTHEFAVMPQQTILSRSKSLSQAVQKNHTAEDWQQYLEDKLLQVIYKELTGMEYRL
ncbi:MAG: AAA family ATPase [Spirochaetota bacterium]